MSDRIGHSFLLIGVNYTFKCNVGKGLQLV